jgi:peptidoglycan/LPS O-acetylase OafA/YrhL
VGGLLIVALGGTFALAFSPRLAAALDDVGISGSPGLGWELVLIVGSLAVIAYAVLTRERGPAFIGVLALAIALALVAESGDEPSVVGWPLVLLLAAGAALALGLRPGDGDRGAPAAPAGTPPPGE